MRAVLSTGSNIGDSRAHLASVREEFAGELIAVSRLYATPPWGGVDQDDFLNQILIVEVTETPVELLARCQRLEAAAERVRVTRWGPRTLDVDIVALLIDDHPLTISTPDLTVPHPRAKDRAFVLVPWAEVNPEATLDGVPISQLLCELDPADVAGVQALGEDAQ
ncbi:2-amino-4-hydroxy-6-hydroxymethyldihydropteridine diphosphokinase [Corynebacterium aquatimens]|uniref:2-amino-4-hydroxy-6-hydroxymethyldihydropteridine diphosphokinase n=1 Tax=Corynebacterium aquatimens TaxID=1190508 RepID=A0A931E0A1_9CORY|nr:2-amino-4-hydroxy-6-hydroxymethyldihydropteridine diphosphokinase [Corynebacterium aquatimens]MBG6122344.1 2-amino-4-hydroxy-6-hydroxymethyldihydropteridine diphosphokinase [Corynebacterium aquatimens]WJY65113.1 2-amino-4-hydroxy-6-hydroxymethyldihydropteridine pyrophosphokinase [Corynebacterium aquatimens]